MIGVHSINNQTSLISDLSKAKQAKKGHYFE